MQPFRVGEAEARGLPRIDARHVEGMKWLAFACMLIDHLDAFVFKTRWPIWDAIGAPVFPLFAIALGVGLAQHGPEKAWLILPRMLAWSIAAQVAVTLVRGELVFTALTTLTLGVWLFAEFTSGKSTVRKLLCVCAVVAISARAEFLALGPAVVTVACWWARQQTVERLIVLMAAVGLLFMVNGSAAALLGLPIAYAVTMLNAEVPRVRHAFYIGYVAQFPILRALRECVA